jgi:hypothetical protein
MVEGGKNILGQYARTNKGATSYLCKVNVIEALARDHESWPCGESRNARFEASPCRSGFRLRLARRQVAASALRAFAARQDTNAAACAAHEYAGGYTNIGQLFAIIVAIWTKD